MNSEPREQRVTLPYKMALNMTEFAEMMGISKPKAYEIVRRNDFHGVFKIGKRTLISVPRALEWIEAQADKNEKP